MAKIANDPEHSRSPAWTYDPFTGKPYEYEHMMPSSPNGRDPLKGSPWWVRAIAYVGLPAAFGAAAFFGFYMAFINLSTAPQENKVILSRMESSDRARDQYLQDNFKVLVEIRDTQTKLLRSICQSVAKTDLQRNECNR